MTNKEAIERLKQNRAAAEFYAGMTPNSREVENELKDIEAIDMAIEALTEKNIARDIATILENEQDMRAILQNGELVRCKDCRHSDTTGVYVEDVVYCKWLHTSCVKNGYCHRGERKGGDTE